MHSSRDALELYRDGAPPHPRPYADLHAHVLALARAGLLHVIDDPINKDTEMHPLVRPPLTAQAPWHGYDLGHWPPELERQARMAVRSDYFALSDELEQQRRGDVAMNSPVRHDQGGGADT